MYHFCSFFVLFHLRKNDICNLMEDDTFPNGIKLMKRTKVIYAIFSMGRMKSIRKKDCSEFKPERRLTKNIYFMSEAYYKFTTFNGGSRLCLGKDFAYYQTKYVQLASYFVTMLRLLSITLLFLSFL